MIYPANLEKGYYIGVTASSAGLGDEVDFKRLDSAKCHFEKLGYPVITTPNVGNYDRKGRSSDGATRAKELLGLIKDPMVRAIFAASGGDFLMEMLPHVDYEAVKEHPKWIQGFSDTTGLTFTITTNLDIATIYSYNFSTFGMGKWHPSLSNSLLILEGNDISQSSFKLYQEGYYPRITGLEEFVLDKGVEWRNIYPKGRNDSDGLSIRGRILGGCLDILLSLVGTRFDKTVEFAKKYKEDGILWFLESYNLSSGAMIRGLWQLKEAGWFTNAVGFIFGRPAMYEMQYGLSYEESILSVLEELDLPIIMDVDIGHVSPQFTMINGALGIIESKNNMGTIVSERR